MTIRIGVGVCCLLWFALWSASARHNDFATYSSGDLTPTTNKAQRVVAAWLPYVNALPSSDGLGLYVSVGQVGQVITTVYGFVCAPPDCGPTGYMESHTLSYAGTVEGLDTFANLYNGVFGSPAGVWPGTVTISATTNTTTPLQVGPLNFVRYAITATQATELYADDGLLKLQLESNSLASNAYGLVMPAYAPPGPLPFNYAVAGSIYNVRTSGAIVSLNRPGVLWLYYTPETLGALDPTKLHIYIWDGASKQWVDLGGAHLSAQQAVVTTIQRFGVYALLAPRGPIYTTYLPLAQR